ncbi:RHS repeat domain-containing protein [Pseudocitrobacter sp. Cyp-38S]|uniref:RHS repeat domain-containing protein n=1 Tax=Pseudocitrobacter cyperus TaxID=3112843 RepID=A0ABV0HE51_9ENTR
MPPLATALNISQLRACTIRALNILEIIFCFAFGKLSISSISCCHFGVGPRLRTIFSGSSPGKFSRKTQINLDLGDEHYVLAEFERDRLHRETQRSQGRLLRETRYDATGRIMARITDTGREVFRYDAASNRTEELSPPVLHNQVTAAGVYR